jgi:hypothetical protein
MAARYIWQRLGAGRGRFNAPSRFYDIEERSAASVAVRIVCYIRSCKLGAQRLLIDALLEDSGRELTVKETEQPARENNAGGAQL